MHIKCYYTSIIMPLLTLSSGVGDGNDGTNGDNGSVTKVVVIW